MAKALVITEKPSVARDIAAALGGFREHDGYWESDEWLVTFAVGHLFELLMPEELDEKFKRWTLDVLPILPERFELKKKKGQSERIRVIEKLMARKDVARLVNACDAGREGELIFREVVDYLSAKNEHMAKPVLRLWLQSMTRAAIRSGFESLRPGRELAGLAAAAECRARSDWLIGMNATRALTKRLASRREKTAWSAGRVQTPTLALLVEREFEVLAHVPEAYWRVLAHFTHEGERYEGVWYDPAFAARGEGDERRDDQLFDEARAQAVLAEVRAAGDGDARASETRKPSREAAPPLFDLTSLQRESNRRFGWSARRTLGAAQRCYERHKLLTYPRTDSKALPNDYREPVAEVLTKFAESTRADLADYARAAAHLKKTGLQNEQRIFNDKLVSDHFAIIPTGTLPATDFSGDDRRVFDLVMRRFLGGFHPPALWERVERTTKVAGADKNAPHHFRTRTRALMEPGWRAVLPENDAPQVSLPPLAVSDARSDVAVTVAEADAEEQQTRPPARITEARLLTLMEHAGRAVEDEELAAVLSDKGLGTPATRADIIENLIAKSYAVRVGKALRPTVKGIRLIDTLKRIHIERLASAALTGEIEQHLRDVEHGTRSADDFMNEMRQYASDIVERTRAFDYDDVYRDVPPLGACPKCGRPVIEMAWFYRCQPQPDAAEGDDCPMRFWKDSHGRYLDRTAIRALLTDGRTPELDGFTARNGRTYRGVVEVDTEEWKLRVTGQGWNDDGGYQMPEYEVEPEPLGACPFDAKCEVAETATHFVCRAQAAHEKELAAYREARKVASEKGEKMPKKPAAPAHGFTLPRTVCKREITRAEALHYLREGRTELLEDFTSRMGRPFSAILFQKETGKHGFEFPPRGKNASAAAADGAKRARPKKATKKKRAKRGRKTASVKKPTKRKPARKRATRRK